MNNKKWKKFEKLVLEIQKVLSPTAVVKHDDKIIGKQSGTKRQIDISIKQSIGQYEILIVIDCKDYRDPVDLKGVEEFIGLVKDVQANKGAIVSASGFTTSAKLRAENAGINLYRIVDTKKHDWQTFVSMPTVCDFRRPRVSFRFSSTQFGPFKLPNPQLYDYSKLMLYDDNDQPLGEVLNLFINVWNSGSLPEQLGEHRDIGFIDGITKIKYEDEFYFVKVTANFFVISRLFFGELDIEEISGFSDEISGGIITTGFKTGILDAGIVEKEWKLINSIEDLAIKPVAVFMALDVLRPL